MFVALAVSFLPGLVESSQLFSSTASGPLLGVFLLALLFPSANKYVSINISSTKVSINNLSGIQFMQKKNQFKNTLLISGNTLLTPFIQNEEF